MKTKINKSPIVRALALGAAAAFLSTQAQATVILSDSFTSATVVGSGTSAYIQSVTSYGTNNWYSTQPNAAGGPSSLTTDTILKPTGNVLNFAGNHANGNVVAAFTPVTLVAGGANESIQFTLAYHATATPTSSGPLMGLYNNGGTPVASNYFYAGGGATPVVLQDDKGYNFIKVLNSTSSDMKIQSETMNAVNGKDPFYIYGNQTSLVNASTGINANNTTSAYTMGIKLTLQVNGNLLVAATFNGITNTTTVLAASVLTTTFNEIAFTGSPAYAGGGYNIDNIVVQTVPEPATWALLAFSLTTVMVLRRRRS